MNYNYDVMVDNIYKDREAFEFCISKLFPLMNYNVLTINDVRPIDLKEWLSRISNKIPDKVKEQYPGTDDSYMFMLKLYLDEKIRCKTGSRAEKYKKRAYELIKEAKTDTSLHCTKDALMILLSLFRTIKDMLDECNKWVIPNLELSVKLEDADLLYAIYTDKNLYPGNVIEKKDFLDKVFGTDYDTRNAVTYFYINSIVLLTRMLQERGIFSAKEKS